jgi:multidrug efflux pump subunit AcrA (membrane-fusion protein)
MNKKILFLLFLLTLSVTYAVYLYYSPVEVETSFVKRGPVIVLIAATGRVEAQDHAALSSRIGGRVRELPYDEGDRVKKGEIVAVLESKDIDASVEEAQQRVEASQAHLDRLRAGSRPEEVAEQQARVLERKSELELAKAKERRGSRLLKDGYISQSEYDDLLTSLKVAEQRFNAEQKRLTLVKKGHREEEIEEALREVQAAESVLQRLLSDRKELFIQSPLDGVVTKRHFEPGETVSPHEVILEVADPNKLEIKVQVEETDAGKVKTGQNAYLLPDIFPDKSIRGKVVHISPIADYSQGTIEVTVIAQEEAPYLKPGMTVDTSIEVKKIPDSLLLPLNAILREDDSEYVYITKDSYAHKVDVKTGTYGRTYSELKNGLKEGQEVITSVNSGLRDGRRVIIKGHQALINHNQRAPGTD